jgi:DNA-binding transcriptional ArsR family regulator
VTMVTTTGPIAAMARSIPKGTCGGSCNGCEAPLSAPNDLDRTLSALADPTRRGVIELLREQPRKASDLADALGLSRPAMSRHLRILRKSGLVTESELEHDARVRMYRLQRAPFSDLSSWLTEVEAFWGDQLAAFKRHAEGNGRKKR